MEFLNQVQLYLFAFDVFIVILIIITTAVIARISGTLIERALKPSSPYLAAHIRKFAVILIWAIGIILGIKQMGISTDILIILMGLAGIGFIASAIYVLQNLVSRSFLDIHMQYKVGEVISIKNFKGKVIEITDFNTVLLDKEGSLIAVPNMQFLKEIWVKQGSISGYEMIIPVTVDKEIDVVNFEKELLNSTKELNKYFKKEPNVVASKTDEKTNELSLILSLKDPEKKSVVAAELTEKIEKLIAEFKERSEKEKKEKKLKEIKDLSNE